MIGELSLSQAAIAFGGTLLFPDCQFREVSTDTRTLEEGQLFVALKGDNFDGHDYLQQAALKACGLVVSEPDKRLNLPQWVVGDTTIALGQLGQLNRNQFDGKLVALTGSVGKTTVKEMVAAIFARKGETLATKGNLNNHIGVPKTVLELEDNHRYAVIEMGASGPGEIDYLCQVATPDIALVNNVMAAHLEGFGSESVIAETKGAVYSRLGDDGVAVINLDSPWAQKFLLMAGNAKVITFSLEDSKADVHASVIDQIPGKGVRFTLHIGERASELFLPMPGNHNVANALAAAACAHSARVHINEIVTGLESVVPVKGRLEPHKGINGSMVIDDSYNANPGSVTAAIDVLAAYKGQKILVLGDMAELGSMSSRSHREVGAHALEKGVDECFVTGRFAEHTARGFGGNARVFPDRESLVDALKPMLNDTATVLVKGSRSAAMEKVVARIIEENSDASLVG